MAGPRQHGLADLLDALGHDPGRPRLSGLAADARESRVPLALAEHLGQIEPAQLRPRGLRCWGGAVEDAGEAGSLSAARTPAVPACPSGTGFG